MNKVLATALFSTLLANHSFASEAHARPISSEYGICLNGMRNFELRLDSPTDVEFASLIYKKRVIGQFEITILGPNYKVYGKNLRRWKNGEIVLVKSENGYVGMKKYYSGDAYPNVYVYLSIGRSSPNFINKAFVLKSLSSCGLKAHRRLSSPPKLDSLVSDSG